MVGRKRTKNRPTKQQAGSQRTAIDQWLASKAHPLENEIQWVRSVMLGVDPSIREGIKWNSVSFRNDHDFFATVNLRSTDSLQLIFHTGAKKKATTQTGVQVEDPRGLIEKWPAKDRCVVTLGKGAGLKANRAALAHLVRDWLPFVY